MCAPALGRRCVRASCGPPPVPSCTCAPLRRPVPSCSHLGATAPHAVRRAMAMAISTSPTMVLHRGSSGRMQKGSCGYGSARARRPCQGPRRWVSLLLLLPPALLLPPHLNLDANLVNAQEDEGDEEHARHADPACVWVRGVRHGRAEAHRRMAAAGDSPGATGGTHRARARAPGAGWPGRAPASAQCACARGHATATTPCVRTQAAWRPWRCCSRHRVCMRGVEVHELAVTWCS